MRQTSVALFGSLVLLASSCRKEKAPLADSTVQHIAFTSTIEGLPQTRVSGTQWGSGDSIGISMYRHGVPPTSSSIIPNSYNLPYITSGNGNFSPKYPDRILQFPAGQEVDFVAYHPYKNVADGLIPLDISKQQDPSALDFMVAYNLEGKQSASTPVSLSFERQMAKVELKIQGSDLAGLQASFSKLPVKARFDLGQKELLIDADEAAVEGYVYTNTENETIISWTLYPMSTTGDHQIVFTKSDGRRYTWNLGAAIKFEKGNRYQYAVTLGKDGGVDPTPTVSYMELPVIQSSGSVQYSMKMSSATRRNYAMLYDTDKKVAYWVAYPLSKDYLGDQDRTDDWNYDPSFLPGLQADLFKGYPNNSQLMLDRGHQLPSGDRTFNYRENASTFYFTNMTPQNRDLNQGVWANLENKVRTWTVEQGVDTMYVVTGAMLTTATDTKIDYVMDNSGKQVAKPKYYYKALAMKRGTSYYTIGFRMENKSIDRKADYMNYIQSVASLEEETGYTFFPALSKSTKETVDTKIWKK